MTRSDLVAQLAERFSQLTHRDTEFAVKTILDAMSDALARGHRIEIRGFGSFSINRRPPRVGRNPRSGEQVVIPEKLVPHFKPGKALRAPRQTRGHARCRTASGSARDHPRLSSRAPSPRWTLICSGPFCSDFRWPSPSAGWLRAWTFANGSASSANRPRLISRA